MLSIVIGPAPRRYSPREGPAPPAHRLAPRPDAASTASLVPRSALRSRGVSLLPRFARETTHAASYWAIVGQEGLSRRSIAGTGSCTRRQGLRSRRAKSPRGEEARAAGAKRLREIRRAGEAASGRADRRWAEGPDLTQSRREGSSP